MAIQVKDGKASVSISGDYDVAQLTALIDEIGKARREMANDPERPELGKPHEMLTNPNLWTQWGPMTGNNFVLMTCFPNFGWRGVLLSPAIASAIGVYIAQYMAYLSSLPTDDSPAETPIPQGGGGGNSLH